MIEAYSGMKPLPKSDRARSVMTAMADFIARSGFKPGDRLPAEREFMEGLAVGRSTVREVIRQFQALGIVESRKGSGTYLLRGVSADTVHMPLSFDSARLRDILLQTLDVRRGLEAEASAIAPVYAGALAALLPATNGSGPMTLPNGQPLANGDVLAAINVGAYSHMVRASMGLTGSNNTAQALLAKLGGPSQARSWASLWTSDFAKKYGAAATNPATNPELKRTLQQTVLMLTSTGNQVISTVGR